MIDFRTTLPTFFVLLLLMCFAPGGLAQETREDEPETALNATITALDNKLFGAYNRCELEEFASLIAEDIEFYHDESGLDTEKESIVNALRQNICGKVRRELVPGSMEVFPLKGYGAVQTGTHRFHHPGRDDVEPVGEARFLHIWRHQDGEWRLTRIVSFDHHALPR